MCSACKKLSKVFDGSQSLIVSRFDNKTTGHPTLILCQELEIGHPESVVIEVKYCPWCGERLYGDGDG